MNAPSCSQVSSRRSGSSEYPSWPVLGSRDDSQFMIETEEKNKKNKNNRENISTGILVPPACASVVPIRLVSHGFPSAARAAAAPKKSEWPCLRLAQPRQKMGALPG